MTKKPISLTDVMAKKASVAVEPATPAGTVTKTLTLRLPQVVHDQLREISFTTRRSQHDLLMEALNDLFSKFGKPPIAPVSQS